MITSVYFFDTEATDKENGELIEAAWLKVAPVIDLAGESDAIPSTLPVTEVFEQRYMPQQRITFGAMAVHHIFEYELYGCPPSHTFALPEDCEYIIGHSIDFDWQLIGRPNVKRICTDALARHLYPTADSYSLVALAYMTCWQGIRPLAKNAHGAKADCDLVRFLLLEMLKEIDVTTWRGLWEISERCRTPLRLPFSRHKGTPLEALDDGMVNWCLRQDWITEDLRVALEQVLDGTYVPYEIPRVAKPVVASDSDDNIPF